MKLYNVVVTTSSTMVVAAEDEGHAYRIARYNIMDAINDYSDEPDVYITGEITSKKHLHDGWTGDCIPYGGDGNTNIEKIISRFSNEQK